MAGARPGSVGGRWARRAAAAPPARGGRGGARSVPQKMIGKTMLCIATLFAMAAFVAAEAE
jgi:hypothetical protein